MMAKRSIQSDSVRCGIDRLETVDRLLKHQTVGLLTSAASIDHEFRHSVNRVAERYQLKALFAPEHGIRGEQQAGALIDHQVDAQTGLPVYSLYGENKAPSDEQLAGIDVFVIDLQDVGARFYTYLYSMIYCMKRCAEMGIPVVVLDRPNPVGGNRVEGPVLDPAFSSFVGLYPVPVRYGLTIAEFAGYINHSQSIGCELSVAPLSGWHRNACYDETGLTWVSPSPNIPTIDSALVYLGTCLFEGTNLSEGRGTTHPFELIGAPWLDHDRVLSQLNKTLLTGCHLRPCWFQPGGSKHQARTCAGFQIHILDRQTFKPYTAAVTLLDAIRQTHDAFAFLPPDHPDRPWFIDHLSGSDTIRRPDFDLTAHCEQADAESALFREKNKACWLYQEDQTG
ncbi:MAG: DUF1343 domain-containing protein [Clostridia bacterium]|nr:DUF1343 domain-containing protein [Clostridia bacterium]